MTDICVVIVTYNGESWIRGNLTALRASSVPAHVVVVDNDSTDATASAVNSEFPEVELIRMPSNVGFGIGNNVGISRSIERGFQYTFLLNQDAFVTPTCLKELRDFLESTDYAAVTPLHCSPSLDQVDQKTLRHYLSRYATDFISDACTGHVRPHYPIRGVNAAAWFIRNDTFNQVGGFDPLFFMYGEDDDLINRLSFHKARFALLPSCRVVHLRQSPPANTTGRIAKLRRIAVRRRSEYLVAMKQPGLNLTHSLLQLITKGILKPPIEFLIHRDGTELAACWLAALKLLTEIRAIRRHARRCEQQGPHFLPATRMAQQ